MLRIIYFSVIICSFIEAHAKDWRGITPLYSTRSDVEKALNVKSKGESSDTFKLPGETVHIVYITEQCEQEETNRWNVPIGTVFSIDVLPQNGIRLSSLNLDMTKFRVAYISDVVGGRVYINDDEGFAIEAHESTDIATILTYGPRKQDDYLMCSVKAIAGINIRTCTTQITPFDPSGSYYFKSKPLQRIYQTFGLTVQADQMANKLVASGAIISLAGTEFKFTNISLDKDTFTFTTEEKFKIRYSFSGKWLLTDRVFSKSPELENQTPLKGVLTRIKKGKERRSSESFWVYKPECYSTK